MLQGGTLVVDDADADADAGVMRRCSREREGCDGNDACWH